MRLEPVVRDRADVTVLDVRGGVETAHRVVRDPAAELLQRASERRVASAARTRIANVLSNPNGASQRRSNCRLYSLATWRYTLSRSATGGCLSTAVNAVPEYSTYRSICPARMA